MTYKELKEKATPLPWFVHREPQGVICNDGSELITKHYIRTKAEGEHKGWSVADVYATVPNNQPANSALIVHCANNFAELEEALEVALEHMEDCNPQDPELVNIIQGNDRCPRDHKNCCGNCAAFYQVQDALAAANNPNPEVKR